MQYKKPFLKWTNLLKRIVTVVMVWLNSVAMVLLSGTGGAQIGICCSHLTQGPVKKVLKKLYLS